MAEKFNYLYLVTCSGSGRQRRKAVAAFESEGAGAKDCGNLIRIASAEALDEGRVRGVLASCGDIEEIKALEYTGSAEGFEHRTPDAAEFRSLTGKRRRRTYFVIDLIALLCAALCAGLYLLGVFKSTKAVFITAGIIAAALLIADIIVLLFVRKAEGKPADWLVYDGIITDSSIEDVLGRDGNYNRHVRFEEFAQGGSVLRSRHISKKKHAVGTEIMLCIDPAKNIFTYLDYRKNR